MESDAVHIAPQIPEPKNDTKPNHAPEHNMHLSSKPRPQANHNPEPKKDPKQKPRLPAQHAPQ